MSRGPLFLLLLLISSCITTLPAYVDLPPAREMRGVEIEMRDALRAPYGFVALRGTRTNTTERHLDSCKVTVRILDKSMEQSGRAVTTVTSVPPGESVEFKADLVRSLKRIHTVLQPEVRPVWAPE